MVESKLERIKKARSEALTPNIVEIDKGLYIGNEGCSKDLDLLKKYKIKHIVIAGRFLEAYFPQEFNYHTIPIDDVKSQDILKYLDDAIEFIIKGQEDESVVLVHCSQGVSRSASICIAYLMKINNWKFEKALDYARNKKPDINPNPGFITQLQSRES